MSEIKKCLWCDIEPPTDEQLKLLKDSFDEVIVVSIFDEDDMNATSFIDISRLNGKVINTLECGLYNDITVIIVPKDEGIIKLFKSHLSGYNITAFILV